MDIAVILDRSGSMNDAKADHEGGLNSFIADQRGLDGDVRFTLIQFDTKDPCEVVYDRAPLHKVNECKLVPRGGTPLLEAFCRGVEHLEKSIGGDKPDGVVVMVITDGEENESGEAYSKERVRDLQAEREAAGWKFLFLAANVDAFAEGGAMGFAPQATAGFANNRRGVRNLYAANSGNVLRTRAAMERGVPAAAAYGTLDVSAAQRLSFMATDDDDPALDALADVANAAPDAVQPTTTAADTAGAKGTT